MRISDLPQEIKELAEKRQCEYKEKHPNKTFDGSLFDAFVWIDTKEGGCFWIEIDDGNFAPFYEKYGKKEFPRRMLVWDSFHEIEMLVLFEIGGKFHCVNKKEEENFNELCGYSVQIWNHAKELTTTKKVEFEVTEEQEKQIRDLLSS